jgi:peptidyl-dipeptidase Dcp
MKIYKALFSLGLASAVMHTMAFPLSDPTEYSNDGESAVSSAPVKKTVNPLLQKSTLPFGAPDFKKIKVADYLPAIEEAIQEQRDKIKSIVNNKQKPSFYNTVLAYEESGVTLDRVTNIFFGLTSADKTPEIAETEKKVVPMLTDLENEITFNKDLFQRIKYVYDHQAKSLVREDKKLLEEIYKSFVRAGALLPDDKMARMKEINMRISELQQQWGDLLPQATNEAVVWVDKKEDLAGLSEADIAQCKKDAESRGGKAPYAIVIINTTQQPILTNLDNRELRKKVFEASCHRADGTGAFNTFPIVSEIARLRAEKGALMGYDNYASYSLEKTMAKNTANVDAFLNQLIKAYAPKAAEETRAIEEFARKTMGSDFQLQPYDRFYYSAKMKQQQFNLSDDEVKPYFNLDSVQINGVFYAANLVYGLTFKQRKDIPTYHPDMKVFEVRDKTGQPIALFYSDFFRRPTKRGGAWMSAFVKQSNYRHQLPIIYNVLNCAKAPEGQPTLLTWDEVTTLFHEFGHALHGILSKCKYNTLSGTAVARDFVEMPSQFNESFASIPQVFDHYARHAVTGKPMPADLKEKMLKSINFHAAYALGENLAATCLDLEWHKLKADEVPGPEKAADFEREALKKVGLLDVQIPPRYSTSYFNHVWGGGYAAGYYSYLWTEVLAVNVAQYFADHGPLKREVGQAFRDKILSRGNTGDLMKMFSDFTGLKAPDSSALLKARGVE